MVSTTKNGEGYDTSEDSSSDGEIDNALHQRPRTSDVKILEL